MGRKMPVIKSFSAISVTLLTLSPMFGPQEVMAATITTNSWGSSVATVSTTQGQPGSYSVTSSVYQPSAKDTYQYQLQLLDSNGTAIPDLSLDQPNYAFQGFPLSGFFPTSNSQSVTSTVYSTYGGNLPLPTCLNITLSPLDVGNFKASLQLVDATTGQNVGSPTVTSLNVTPASAISMLVAPFEQTVGVMDSTTILTSGIQTTDPVYYHIQVTNMNGSPVPTSAVQISWPDASNNFQPLLSVDGIATEGFPNGIQLSPTGQQMFGLQFNEAGEYKIYATVVDAKTQQPLYFSTGQIYAGMNNVTGTVYGVNNLPDSGIYVLIKPPVGLTPSNNEQYFLPFLQTDSSGNFNIYLPPGQGYNVTGYLYNSGAVQSTLYPEIPFNVSATSGTQLTLNIPQTGMVTGTLTSNGITPVGNGSLTVYPQTSSGLPDYTQQPLMIPVNSGGTFSQSLSVGNYVITSVSFDNQTYNVNESFSITANGSKTLIVQPDVLSWNTLNSFAQGNQVGSMITVAPTLTSDSVYFEVQVATVSGTPVTSGVWVSNQLVTQHVPQIFPFNGSGTAILDNNNPLSLSGSSAINLEMVFSKPGTYVVTYSVLNAATNKVVGSVTKQLTAEVPNVYGTVEGKNGDPLGYSEIMLTNPQGISRLHSLNSLGQFTAYLPPGTWTVTEAGVNGSLSPLPVADQSVIQVPTAGSVNVTVQDPNLTVVSGTATYGGGVVAPNAMLNFYQATATGQPNMNQPFYNIQTDANGNFSLVVPTGTPLYVTTMQAMNGQWNVNQLITASQMASAVTISPAPMTFPNWANDWITNTIYGMPILLNYGVETSDPVYFKVNVMEGTTPVTSGVTIQNSIPEIPNIQTFALDKSGTGVLDLSSPVTLAAGDQPYVQVNFSQPGNYTITYSLMDSKTNQAIATSSTVFNIYNPNVQGTVLAADGKTPAAVWDVGFESSTGQFNYLGVNPSGQLIGYLPSGTWTAMQIVDALGNNITLASSQQITVTTTASGTMPTFQINDPAFNVIGTAYTDGTETNPASSGGVLVQVPDSILQNPNPGLESASGTTQIWAQTNATGNFALDLPVGTPITFVGESTATGYTPLDTPYTVQSGINTITVSPPKPDFQLSVLSGNNKPVASGYVGFVSSADYAAGNFNNAQWFSVQSGVVAGNLPTGNYVAYGISTNTNYYSVDVPLTVTNGTLLTSGTIMPAAPLITGTLIGPGNNPVSNASILVSPVNDPSQTITLTTDANGNFNDLGTNSSGNYGDLLQPSTAYTVDGVSTSTGWDNLSQTFTTPAAGLTSTVNIQIPAPVAGSVMINGQTIAQGYIAFGPSNPIDQTGQLWQWAPIQNGSYSLNLPNGSWIVYGIYDSASGQYYDETNASQTPLVMNNSTTTQMDNIQFSDNFRGQLVSGTTAIPNATFYLSPVANPTTTSQYNQVVAISTDASGDFSANLSSGTWYVIGETDASGNYTQLSQSVTIGSSAVSGLTINIAPNVSGAIDWKSAPSTPADAWVIVEQQSSGEIFAATLNGLTTNTWTYNLDLPAGSYDVLGIDTQISATNPADQGWIDLSTVNGNAFTVQSGSSTTTTLQPQNYSGAITWPANATATSGFVVFNNTTTKQFTSVPFSQSGQFTTTFGSGWTVVGVETSAQYYQATGSFSGGSWSVTVK